MRKRALSTILMLSVLASACSSDETSCDVHADCVNSPIAQEQGRCAPTTACVEGVCDAWCPESCDVTDPDVNPCTDPGWVCEPIGTTSSRCTPTEIACETAADCPKHLPSPTGAWTCDEDICRFPGFTYLYEDP